MTHCLIPKMFFAVEATWVSLSTRLLILKHYTFHNPHVYKRNRLDRPESFSTNLSKERKNVTYTSRKEYVIYITINKTIFWSCFLPLANSVLTYFPFWDFQWLFSTIYIYCFFNPNCCFSYALSEFFQHVVEFRVE